MPIPPPQQRAARRQAGAIGDAIEGMLSYSPEAERALATLPGVGGLRSALQNSAGEFLFKPEDDGTLTSGTYGIDSLGRFV